MASISSFSSSISSTETLDEILKEFHNPTLNYPDLVKLYNCATKIYNIDKTKKNTNIYKKIIIEYMKIMSALLPQNQTVYIEKSNKTVKTNQKYETVKINQKYIPPHKRSTEINP
jgi:hypothetical protein